MEFTDEKLASTADTLLARVFASDAPEEVLRAKELKDMYVAIAKLPVAEKAAFGKTVNDVKQRISAAIVERRRTLDDGEVVAIDVTAPFADNAPTPVLLPTEFGSIHPLSREINCIGSIFNRMGFVVEESREIDDQYHMFESLNFPKNHPARDDYDTFMTVETDKEGDSYIAPAHTSTMQNRIMLKYRDQLDQDGSIAVVVPDRVFRNEDVDARHEHTFYQIEGIYISKNVNVGMLIATLQKFLDEYYGKKLEARINPYYFPFTEPSLEFSLSCPFCDGKDVDCRVCSGEGWIELLGSGMIHPNVLKAAGIDPEIYTGFAFGCGVDRLVMMKYGIEDVRHLESGKLDFLRQF